MFCYRRRTARRPTLVEILSTAGTSCTTNPQQIEVPVMELKHYGRRTRSKPVSTVVSVVNKLDRRRVLLTIRSTCRGEIFRAWVKSPKEVPLFLEIPEYSDNTVCIGVWHRYIEVSLPAQNQLSSSYLTLDLSSSSSRWNIGRRAFSISVCR